MKREKPRISGRLEAEGHQSPRVGTDDPARGLSESRSAEPPARQAVLWTIGRVDARPSSIIAVEQKEDATVRLATAALISVLVGGFAAPALAQGTPGGAGTGAPPAPPTGEVPGSVVPGRDKLGSPSMPGEKMPGDQPPPLDNPAKSDTPSVPGPVPGRDKLGAPPMPGQPAPQTGGPGR